MLCGGTTFSAYPVVRPVVCPVPTDPFHGGRGGRVFYTHAAAAASNDWGRFLAVQLLLKRKLAQWER